MKKLILGALAATMVASPIAAAPAFAQDRGYHRDDDRRDNRNYRRDDDRRDDRRFGDRDSRGQQYRSWRRGERFDRRYAQNYQDIDYRRYRGLRAPPRGYRYVRSGNDAVLIGVTSGIIAAVVAGAIR